MKRLAMVVSAGLIAVARMNAAYGAGVPPPAKVVEIDDPGLNMPAVQMKIRPAGGLPGRWTGRRAAMPAGRRR